MGFLDYIGLSDSPKSKRGSSKRRAQARRAKAKKMARAIAIEVRKVMRSGRNAAMRRSRYGRSRRTW